MFYDVVRIAIPQRNKISFYKFKYQGIYVCQLTAALKNCTLDFKILDTITF